MNWLVQDHDFMSSLTIISREGCAAYARSPVEIWSRFQKQSVFSGTRTSSLRGVPEPTSIFALWSASEGRLLAPQSC